MTSYVKSSYGRGAGIALTCRSDQDYDAGLCYAKCRVGYYGIGPVCWTNCQGSYGTPCGAFCASSAIECTTKNQLFLKAGLNIAASSMELYAAPSPHSLLNLAGSSMDLAIELMFEGQLDILNQ